VSDLSHKGWKGNPSVKRGEKLIPTISTNLWKYRCPPGWRSARILALFAHFVSPRFLSLSLSLSLPLSRSFVPFLSHPLTGVSQFYRHVPPLLSSYLVPSYLFLHLPIHKPASNREKGGGRLTSGHHPRIPQFPTPRTAKRVERHDSFRHSANGSSSDSQPLLAFLISRLLLGAHPLAPFAELFKLPHSFRPTISLPSLYELSKKSRALLRHECLRTNPRGNVSTVLEKHEFFSNLNVTYVFNYARVIWP